MRLIAVICILGALGGVAWTTKTGMDELGVHNAKIESQKAVLKRVARELVTLDSLITVEAHKIGEAETPVEKAESRGRGMQEAIRIAKKQSVLDGEKLRAEKITESREEKVSVVQKRMMKWNLLFGSAAVVLAGFWFGLKKLAP